MTVLTIRTNLTYNSYKSVDNNIIPNMGTNYSQRGNKLFPAWELVVLRQNRFYSVLVFHSLGVMPVTDLKVRKKEVSLAKPDASQISGIFLSVSFISFWAYATR